jgi:3-phosphoshikimate 1-carboxyvinyltransferase
VDLIVHPVTNPPLEWTFQAEGNTPADEPVEMELAAPWMTLAAMLGIRLYLHHVSLDPTRLSFVDALVRMGVRIREEVTSLPPGKWSGTLDIHPSRLRGFSPSPDLLVRLEDQIPLLAVLSAQAGGTAVFRAPHLAAKENRPLCRTLCANLRALDAAVEEHHDGFVIHGGRRLRGTELSTDGDPRLAVAMVIAGLAGDRDSLVRDAGFSGEMSFDRLFEAHFQPVSRAPAQSV